MTSFKTYTELSQCDSFEERYAYLRLAGAVGNVTFGFERYLNQSFYRTREWKSVRDVVIIRDGGCDLGAPGREIFERILVHHMNPINAKDIVNFNDDILNPEYLISTSHNTHNAIHYGDSSLLIPEYVERSPGDTLLWKG